MRRGLALITAGAVAAGTVVASPAFAAGPEARIVRVDATDAHISVLMNAVGLHANDALDPSTATLSLGGRALPAVGQLVNDKGGAVTRTVVLAVDISGSMRGAPLDAAKAAVHTFLSVLPADVKVGLVSFGDRATVVTRPTTDRAALLTATDALATKGETSLYDGVLLALDSVGTSGARTVVVLSDGADTVSTHTAADVKKKLSPDILVDVVPFRTSDANAQVLTAWATATHGRALQATAATDLAAAFTGAAADASNQILITADVPSSYAGTSLNVVTTVAAGRRTLSASAVVTIPHAVATPAASETDGTTPTAAPTASAAPAGPLAVSVAQSPFARKPALYGGLGALFVALLIAFAFAFGVGRRDAGPARIHKSLAFYSLGRRGARRQQEPSHLGDTAVARSAVELADRVAKARGLEPALHAKLEGAGLPLRPGEWLILHLGVTVLVGFLLFSLGGAKPLPAVLGLVIGFALPWAYLSIKQTQRKAKFGAQLPQMLQLVAGSLSAGFSLPQAFDTAAREGEAPMAAELNRALVQARLGMPFEDALETIAGRTGSKDFEWVVMAIRIQRDVGGNLAEVLTTVAETLRERERLRRQVNVLSAEGKLSAYILFALPVVMALYMILVRPAYIGVLWQSPLGYALIVVAVVLQSAGAFWMKKVTAVEV